MTDSRSSEPAQSSRTQGPGSGANLDPIGHNVESILDFYSREEQKVSRSQRAVENISEFLGRPYFLASVLVFVVLWILASVTLRRFGIATFDPPPFSLLQGIVTLGGLLTTTVVLIKQGRLAKLEALREQLGLQVNLLTEQKTSKLINLIEELRRDLPMVKDRHDPESAALQQPTDPHAVLAALDERRETDQR